MPKYKKVNEIDVLIEYYKTQSISNKCGLWCDYIPIKNMAIILETSDYQIQKAYKSLKEKGLMEIIKFPIYFEEYYNGLYDVVVPILYSKVYVISKKGEEYLKDIVKE